MNSFKFKTGNIKHVMLDSPFYNMFEFTFIVNGEKYQTNRLIAELLSPIICQNNFIDETNDTFIISTKVKGDFKEIIEGITKFKKIKFEKETVEDNDNNQYNNQDSKENKENNGKRNTKEFLIEVLKELGNEEYFEISPKYEEITRDNVIERIEEKKEFVLNNHFCESKSQQVGKDKGDKEDKEDNEDNEINEADEEIKRIERIKEIEYIAKNISDFEIEEIEKLDNETIEEIITNSNLSLENEDELIEILMKLYDKDRKRINLFEYICYEYISEEKMREFIESIEFEDLSERIWSSICYRLKQDLRRTRKLLKNETGNRNKHEYRIQQFKYEEEDYNNQENKKEKEEKEKENIIKEMEGIFYHLTKIYGGNIIDKGIINISTSSVFSDNVSYQPKNVVNFNDYYFFYSQNQPNQWICFDFKDKVIEASHYSIRSQLNSGPGNPHPKNWVIEGSKDNSEWMEIDKVEDNSNLNGMDLVYTRETRRKEYFRFIRFRQIGKNWGNSDYIYFDSIEFYGKLKNA